MREIKFRGYDVDKKLMCNITDISFSDNIANGVCFGEWCEFYTNKLMQYTGLKDKNGVEIYEGDIVKAEIYNEEEIGTIEWSNDGLYVVNGNHLQDYNFITIQVIGNIYENPELLKDNQ